MEVGRLRLMLFIIPFLAAAMFQVNAALEWYRFIGGSGVEGVRGIALDRAGKVYVIGGNSSDDFPTSSGAYYRSLKGVLQMAESHRQLQASAQLPPGTHCG